MAEPHRVQAIRDKLKNEYPFLANTHVYDFEKLRGMYKEDSYGSVCDNIITGTYKMNVNRNICISFFSNLDAMLLKGALGDNKTFMKILVDWFQEKKMEFESVPKFMESFNNMFDENIRKTVVDGFKNFVTLGWNQTELEDILKLYYFKFNAIKIKDILLGDISTKEYGQMCKFVNECLDIYRKYKNTRCANKLLNPNSGSTICYELEPFAEAYEKYVYGPSVPKHKGVVSLKKDPENARVYCSVYESIYGYNPLGIFFKNKLSTLGSSGNLMVAGLSITATMFILFILCRFTPVGRFFFPNSRKTRRRWRGHSGDYNGYMEMYGSGSDEYSQDYYTMASEESLETGSGESYNTRMRRPFDAQSAGTFDTQSAGTYDTRSAGTYDTQSTGSFDAQSTGTFNTKSERTRSSKSSRTFSAPSEESFDTRSTGTFDAQSAGTFDTQSTGSFDAQSTRTFNTKSSRTRSSKSSRTFSAPSEESFDMGSRETFDTQSSATFNTGSTGSLNSESEMYYDQY